MGNRMTVILGRTIAGQAEKSIKSYTSESRKVISIFMPVPLDAYTPFPVADFHRLLHAGLVGAFMVPPEFTGAEILKRVNPRQTSGIWPVICRFVVVRLFSPSHSYNSSWHSANY